MEYNPFAARYAELKQNVSLAEDEKNKWCQKIEWYNRFNGNDASSSLWATKRESSSLDKLLKVIDSKSCDKKAKVEDLEKSARPGPDPRYWLSTKRRAAKVELEGAKKEVAQLQERRNSLDQKIQEMKNLIDKQQTDLDRYRNFDHLEAEATIKALTVQIEQLNAEIEEVMPLNDRVDRQLMEPLTELNKLKQRKKELEADIDIANNLEQRLSSEQNTIQKKKIHIECSDRFGESKPTKVIRDKQEELKSVNRNIEKLHDRLCLISARVARVITELVIDGNNLCYQHQIFIGLAALQIVAQRLSSEFKVVIVFDASIRVLLQLRDRDITARFGGAVKVHIVSSRNKADETVLDAAAGTSAYVISNDRFRDYPDKPAVRDKRLIRHEILNGRVFIHDLNVAEDILTAD
jgi:hypothetical protein